MAANATAEEERIEKDVAEVERAAAEMAPWEQHSRVISMRRFDYNAPSSLLRHSHSGFLITCPIKREKSATKEAITLLSKYVECFNSSSSSEENTTSKRRKLSNDGEDANSGDDHDDLQEGEGRLPSSLVKAGDVEGDASPLLSLVKLTKSGLLLFTFPKDTSPDVVDTVSKMILSVESGTCASPLWCHRILPIQATCSLNEKELHEVVSKLVLQFVNNNQKLARPIKFAVAYNRRGIETELNIPKEASNAIVLLDRDKCFEVVASAVTGVVSDSVVDLKSPELAILIELLPLSGVPKGSLVAAVSVLPRNVVSAKPRLSIKALVPDTKTKGKKK